MSHNVSFFYLHLSLFDAIEGEKIKTRKLGGHKVLKAKGLEP